MTNKKRTATYGNLPQDLPDPMTKGRRQLVEVQGRWYTVGPTGRRFLARGTYAFVVQDGKTWVVKPTGAIGGPNPGHTEAALGGRVEYAGLVTFGSSSKARGILREWSNASGHYLPTRTSAQVAGLPLDKFRPFTGPRQPGAVGVQLPVFQPEPHTGAHLLHAKPKASVRIGPAGNIPEHAGAFLERGYYGVTTEPAYAVRVGPPGSYADHLFTSLSKALRYAGELAEAGESFIRQAAALPREWPGGKPGNPVDAVRVYEVPAGARYVQGVTGPQPESASPPQRGYPGGGSQVVLDRSVRLGTPLQEFPVESPPAPARAEPGPAAPPTPGAGAANGLTVLAMLMGRKVEEYFNAIAGTDLEARERNYDILRMSPEQCERLTQQRADQEIHMIGKNRAWFNERTARKEGISIEDLESRQAERARQQPSYTMIGPDTRDTHIIVDAPGRIRVRVRPVDSGASQDTANQARTNPLVQTGIGQQIPKYDLKPRESSRLLGPVGVSVGPKKVSPPPIRSLSPALSPFGGSFLSHTIQAGDRIWYLADHYGFSNRREFTDIVAKANPGIDFRHLRVGQKVNVPIGSGYSFAAPVPSGPYLTGYIRSGQFSQDLALQATLGQSAHRLLHSQGLGSAASSINFLTHTIQAGDRVWYLADRYGFSNRREFTDIVAKANPGIDFYRLRVGQKINVPVAPSLNRVGTTSSSALDHIYGGVSGPVGQHTASVDQMSEWWRKV